jgi:hypothetical protein
MPLDPHRLLPFQGCVFSSTDLTSKQRNKLLTLVKNGGGAWSDQFSDSVTFLVAHRISNSQKISLALSGNVPIVKPDWIKRFHATIKAPHAFVLNWWCLEEAGHPIFKGKVFEIAKGTKNARLLADVIRAHGGKGSGEPDFVIADHTTEKHGHATFVSPQWIWTCVSERKLVDIDSSITFTPLDFAPPVIGVSNSAFVLTNMDDESRIQFADLLRDLGATVCFSFSKNAKLIIVETSDDRLAQLSDEYAIPIVSVNWIAALVKSGLAPDPEPFLVHQKETRPRLKEMCTHLRRCTSRPSPGIGAPKVSLGNLNLFSQMSSDREKGGFRICYEASQPAVAVPRPGCGDPLLSALQGN